VSIVSLSLGSNYKPQSYIVAGLDALHARYGELRISSVFESVAVGFSGANFLNLVVVIETDEPLSTLAQELKRIEDDNDRERSGPKFSGRTLDIDILTFDGLSGVVEGIRLPRNEILENAYVLWPLAQVLPSDIHPIAAKSYEQLWDDYDRSRQQLWPVDFTWQGREISTPTK